MLTQKQKTWLGAAALVLSSSLLTGAIMSDRISFATTATAADTSAMATVQAPSAVAAPAGLVDLTTAAERSVNSVVYIKVTQNAKRQTVTVRDPFEDFFGDFFGRGGGGTQRRQIQTPKKEAAGSGVIISSDGYIVTNNHVVENATTIEVVLNDRRSYEATLIGRDPQTDIALLKIDAEDLTAIPFGNSDNLKVGEWVMAIGNPFNLTSTVTSGIVSAKARNINILDHNAGAIESFIQTDAAVNPGNSGGALVNTDGQLVGINTAIASETGNFTGYAFAVPASIVQKVVSDLREYGSVQRALLGIRISDLTTEVAKENNLSEINGVYVESVNNGSAAEDAGIQKGDIIVAINGKKTNTASELQEAVSQFRPGNNATVTYIRDGVEHSAELTFKNRHNSTSLTTKPADMLGATFEELSKSDLNDLDLNYGVQVTDIQSGKMMNAGIRKGFIITTINNTPIKTVDDIAKIINNAKGGVFIEGIYRNGRPAYYAFGMK